MKRIIHTICFQSLLLVLLAGCRKYDDTVHDLSGNNYIAGTVNLYNDYSADGLTTPLINQPVMVTDASLPVPNFLFSVYSDSSGGFVLPNLRDRVLYTVFSYDSVGGILFSDTLQYILQNDETPVQTAMLNLTVDQTMQNGFVFTVLDIQGNPVPGDTVLIYSSALLAGNPIAADTCVDCNLLLTTNTFGKASAFNLASGPYIAYFILRLDISNINWSATFPFTLGTTKVVRESITVK
jgi:hypothetical protein